MPRGYHKNPKKTIAEIAKDETKKRKQSNTPEIPTELTLISTKTPKEGNYTPKAVKSNTEQNTPVLVDVLENAQINVPNMRQLAAEEGITGTNAYAANRIGCFSRQEILAKSAKIKQIARQRGYKLDELVHDPQALQSALDDYDLTCLDMGLYPLQNLLAVWLNTTSHQIIALCSAANVSESGQILAAHNDYCISVISSSAMLSDKPPLFSVYYLKTAYGMFDDKKGHSGTNVSLISGNVTNINVSAADISKNMEVFAEIDDKKNG